MNFFKLVFSVVFAKIINIFNLCKCNQEGHHHRPQCIVSIFFLIIHTKIILTFENARAAVVNSSFGYYDLDIMLNACDLLKITMKFYYFFFKF